MSKNLYKDILNSNIKDESKKELLNLIDSGYGLYFSKKEFLEETSYGILEFDKSFGEKGNIIHSLIEGDNYGVLKTLNNSFNENFVDFIYIDPPYNSKNNLTYEDNRHHSQWLQDMEKTLKIAKSIMKKEAFISISIDDSELYSLKLLMDKIFGEKNFIHNLIWRKKSGGGQDSKFLVNEHEYVLVYAKNISFAQVKEINIKRSPNDFKTVINGKKSSLMKLEKWGIGSRKEDAPTLHYSIKDPNGNDFFPMAPDGSPGRWRKKPENLPKDKIFWKKSGGRLIPYEVKYFDDFKYKKIINRSILYNIAENAEGTKELTKVFGKKGIFDYPKPTKLIEFLINNFVTSEDSVILDFFAGSGTTFQAVSQYNKKNNSSLRCILVNRNEKRNKIFDEITLKRALKVNVSKDHINVFRFKEKKYDFIDDYEEDIANNIQSYLIIGKGAQKITEEIFSSDEKIYLYCKLNSILKIENDIRRIIDEHESLGGYSADLLIHDNQELNQSTIDFISSKKISIIRIPKSFVPYEVGVK